MTSQFKGLLITFAGVLFVVPDSLFVRLIDADPLVIAFWRNGLAGGLILIGLLALKGSAPFREVLSTGRYGALYIVTLALSGVLFVMAISLTSVANAVFIIAAMPIFASIFSWIFLGERISLRMVLTIAAVLPGLALIAYGSGETEHASWRGDLAAVLVAASFAAGLTAARRVRHVSMVPAVPMAYCGSALVLLPFIEPMTIPADQLVFLPFYAVFIVFSASLLALGPRYITSAEVALLILLESVLAPLLVWVVLGENPGSWTLIGGTIVIGALAASNLVVLMRKRSAGVRS
ncbi:DMT family transporter [Shimia sediminis]|uniref:DMT family transporter n=1 Tax=Shimia sediminis TaxID=2497945 RepID=UPI000F8D298D|nr:DMT family transporter [Shimia sediminis]